LRPIDLLLTSLGALFQQKVRTALTVLGIVIGTFVLVVCLSVGSGVREAALREFRRHDQLRQIVVHPGYGGGDVGIPPEELVIKGDMSDAKRERLRQSLIEHYNRRHARQPKVALTKERLEELARLDHVTSVVPVFQQSVRASLGGKGESVFATGTAPDNRHVRRRLIAGEPFTTPADRSVLVTEYLLYRWGIPGDEEVRGILGQKIRLEFRPGRQTPALLLALFNAGADSLSEEESRVLQKTIRQLPAALETLHLTTAERDLLKKALQRPSAGRKPVKDFLLTEEFTIVGVLRESTKDDHDAGWTGDWWSRSADVLLLAETAESLLFRLPGFDEDGVHTALLTVDDEDHVKEVVDQVKEMGLTQFSLIEIMERVRTNLTLLTFATGFVAGVALVVAALGITNTMVMSVLERTREIGVMKAVGARDSHVQLIFLVEGALIGAVGGGLGLFLSWLASFPGDRIARSLMEKQGEIKVEESLFVFPVWLVLGVPLFAALVTTLAAVYPARKAARVNPIAALRHE
jgi:putative ABC transport system permease protein